MTLTPVALTIGSTTIDLDDVLADVTIRHGRVDVYESASRRRCSSRSRTCPVRLRARSGSARPWCSPAPTARPWRRALPGGSPTAAVDDSRLTAIAVGRLATLSSYAVGTVDYPAEAWTARVTRVFTDAGLAAYLQLVAPVGGDPQLAARVAATEGLITLDQYLGELADTVGCAVADTPDGKILVQPIYLADTRRAGLARPAPGRLRAGLDAGAAVRKRGNGQLCRRLGQRARRRLGAFYGFRPVTIETDLTSGAAALARANERLARGPRIRTGTFPRAPYLVGKRIGIGTPVLLSGMPAVVAVSDLDARPRGLAGQHHRRRRTRSTGRWS